MGVQGLWDLLAPVGRRVSVETLAGKKLAIDASIWMVQFMKAMRDEKGEMVRNAHILGFFRRICKLLFLRTKPVFVFDGGTPALKRRTVAARRRNRENAKAKIRKTAEKLLLNHLKAKKLEELALELKNSKQKPDGKGKQVMVDGESSFGRRGLEEKVEDAASQEKLDEMLAASLAAEEEGKFSSAEPSSALDAMEEENSGDDEEEMMFPIVNSNIDPSVLASLPPSMQLDLLVQMRERLMAENRQKYQKLKKMPAKFSELQIQSYLKTVAFRREIDEVQKSSSGTGMGGVQTSRIASESNREFIFSSSFTGDKQVLKSAGVQNNGVMTSDTLEEQTSHSGSLNSSTNKLKFISQACVGNHFKIFGDDVKTIRDERGHIQVSKSRGLGIHMTRDLQRNLALMKENEHDNNQADGLNGAAHVSNDDNIVSVSEEDAPIRLEKSNVCNEGILEISFSKEDCLQNDTVEDLFTSLVAGNPTSTFSMDITPSEGFSDESGLDIWEGKKAGSESNDICMEREVYHGDTTLEDDEVDWEEGICNIPVANFPCQSENNRTISRGNMEEESDLQEAIRRSLEDMQHGKPDTLNNNTTEVLVNPSPVSCKSNLEQCCSSQSTVDKFNELVDSTRHDGIISPRKQFSSITLQEDNNNANLAVINEVKQVFLVSGDTCTEEKGLGEPCVSNVFDDTLKDIHQNPQETHVNQNLKEDFNRDVGIIVTQQKDGDDRLPKHGSDMKEHLDDAMEVLQNTVGKEDELVDLTEAFQAPANKAYPSEDRIKMQQDILDEVVRTQAVKDPTTSLDNEISYLRQEREQIGNEQRRLERNAESVSSEMFAECQELLQMFGLPYIIAPMEAEAQCAYMELINLVDGVVTDDSDVFLFGARSIYKNIFDDRKYVETYFMKDIETELGLTREKLIHMALLLGSDYTEGVSGIGIVNAIEVLNAFPEDDGLQKFKEWVESPDPSILGKLDPHKRGSIRSLQTGTNDDKLENVMELLSSDDGSLCGTCELDNISDAKKFFMSKHRNISKNWHIPSSFPSKSVVSAYVTPQVDQSTESFSWGKPDLPLLRKLCWERFGWSNQKADELLFPVLKEYNKHETQLRLEAFYTFNEKFAKIRSRRIKKAVKGITGKLSVELSIDPAQASADSQKGINPQPKQSQSEQTQSTRKQLNGNRSSSKSSEENMELLSESQNQKKGGVTKVRGSLRGRREGKEIVGKEQNFDFSESNFSGGEGIHSEKPVQVTEAIPMPRRLAKRQKQLLAEGNTQKILAGPCGKFGRNSGEVVVGVNDDSAADKDNGLVGCSRSNSLEESMPTYLVNGGGFCNDDNEEENSMGVEQIQKSSDTGKAAFPTSKTRMASTKNITQFSGEERLEPCSEKTIQRSSPPAQGKGSATTEGAPNSQRECGAPVLSAMPSLRRKRKKF